MVVACQFNQMADGELIGPPFIAGIHGLRSAQHLCNLLLRFVCVFPQITDSFLITFHGIDSSPSFDETEGDNTLKVAQEKYLPLTLVKIFTRIETTSSRKKEKKGEFDVLQQMWKRVASRHRFLP